MNAVTQEGQTAMQVVQHEQGELSPVAPQRPSLNTVGPADLLRYALDSGADLDRLEKLMELQERDNANKARMAFVAAMAEFKKNAPTILQDKDVSFKGTSYSHATLGAICEVVIEALARCGISHDWDTQQPASGMITSEGIGGNRFSASISRKTPSGPAEATVLVTQSIMMQSCTAAA